ncbi:hypothetical protein A2740_02385 [Candidatus Nomurabacteria bacterium RIFCSPHIGHO2_01_FULL_43_16]|nr:MAG: hypothetical protein A2740_02385 [Candidatus Nomurabacteria bacterium RIFCSPHIGHO2_01_FULL_43_16]OGI97381.1 MAG: hypothetical protein A3A11_02060 [Candidatus Nomurabacteria bacterium RIFCSPLOWO2_01_FULL_43_15]
MKESKKNFHNAEILSVISRAVEWAEKQADRILKEGEPLNPSEVELARIAGVRCPERVRILKVSNMPTPEDPKFTEAAKANGFLWEQIKGLTLGYGIYIMEEYKSARLVSHELRHVFQFEQTGSLSIFLQKYLQQLISFGYDNAPFEIDARKHEQGH